MNTSPQHKAAHHIWWHHMASNAHKTLITLVCLATTVSANSGAQSLHGKTILLPIGTTFEGRLDSKISSNRSKEGERFTISMSTPVLANGSEVVIPAGSQILGEVVEAINAGSIPHKKRTPKPFGKLRVQLSGLKTPDGANYPLVGSLAPEQWEQNAAGGNARKNQNLGGGIGYVGTDNSFNSVRPGTGQRGAGKLVERRDMQRHALYGKDDTGSSQSGAPRIRSLLIKGRDIYIDSGSPVSIRLDAPLKIAVHAPGSAESPFSAAQQRAPRTSERRFAPQNDPPPEQQEGTFTPNNSLPFLNKPAQPQGGGGLPFLNKPAQPMPQANQQDTPPGAPAMPPLNQTRRPNDF